MYFCSRYNINRIHIYMATKEVKVRRLSRVTVPKGEDSPDSIVRAKAMSGNDRSRGQRILMEAQNYYTSGYRFRMGRDRNKRYTYGDQWGDVICVDGKEMTEEEYIKMQGQVPLKNNLIRRLVRNVIGSYVNQGTEPRNTARDRDEQPQAETLNALLEYVMQINEMDEMYSHAMREFLISGMPVMRKWYGWNDALQKEDCWTSAVLPNMFMPDFNMRDPRGWDCQFVGEIHDVSFEEMVTQFAKSPEEYKRLTDIYKAAEADIYRVMDPYTKGLIAEEYAANGFMDTPPAYVEHIRAYSRYTCNEYRSNDLHDVPFQYK